jgi:hypothetical protein
MNKKLSPVVQAYLNETHGLYSSYNQSENSTSRQMAEKGHPMAMAYRKLRAFFDSLAYACNSSARRFSHKNDFECSEYWAPELDLSWYPKGEVLSHFGHIYPALERWNEYIQAVADAGWPEGAEPGLKAGSWLIRTQNEKLRAALLKLRDKGHPITLKPAIDGETETVFYDVSVYFHKGAEDVALHHKIVTLLQKHHKGYVLPARTPEQAQADTAPLPLEQKQFMLGNVKEVTVKDRIVLVPLVALPMDETLVLGHIDRVLGLIHEGFPFVQAKDWLQQWVTPETFKDFEQRYA